MKGLKGKKRRGTHSSAIAFVETVIKSLQPYPIFKSIRLGEITTGGRANSEKRMKITRLYITNSSPLLVKIKDNSTLQECTIFTSDTDTMVVLLRKIAEVHNCEVSDINLRK